MENKLKEYTKNTKYNSSQFLEYLSESAYKKFTEDYLEIKKNEKYDNFYKKVRDNDKELEKIESLKLKEIEMKEKPNKIKKKKDYEDKTGEIQWLNDADEKKASASYDVIGYFISYDVKLVKEFDGVIKKQPQCHEFEFMNGSICGKLYQKLSDETKKKLIDKKFYTMDKILAKRLILELVFLGEYDNYYMIQSKNKDFGKYIVGIKNFKNW